jgi:hypothetical protein
VTNSARVPTVHHDGWLTVTTSWSFCLYAAVLLLTSYFVYRYARYSPWRATSVGRGLMTLATAIAAVDLNPIVSILAGPDWVLRDLMRLLTLGYSVVALAYMTKNLIQLQGGWRQDPNRDPRTDLADRGPR